ncbi:DUF6344 domain-containing protein [Streptomyces sp. enrichment culture]|uniref:DUF6344 domain-containing protein n=1 Tax=Streptomyces sp. enrichment culture TaxID=1795815 RepID=UPI003F554FEE
MARNKVMQLWTAFVTAFLALCTALGLVTTTAAAATTAPVPQTEPARNSSAPVAMPAAMPLWAWSHARSLPPTMKQRIHAEAHGKTPSCRHLPLIDAEDAAASPATDTTASGPAETTASAPAHAELSAPAGTAQSTPDSTTCGTGPLNHGTGLPARGTGQAHGADHGRGGTY